MTRTNKVRLLAGLAAAAILAPQAGAQTHAAAAADPHDEDATILVTARNISLTLPTLTGSRLGLSPLETPASIAVVDGAELRARGDLSIVDAVTRSVGITTAANPGNGGTALAARGFSGQGSVLQLVDGVRLFPVAGTITFPTDPWTVDRIEVLSGPSSVLYGQGALGGAVNIVTKQPTRDPHLAGEVGYGSQDSRHAAAGAGGPIGETLSFRVDGSYRRSDGYVDRGDSKSLALAGALRFQPVDTLSITLHDDYGNLRPMEYFGTPLIAGRPLDANRRRNYNVADADIHYRDNRTTLAVEWSPSDAITLANTAYRLTSKRLFKDLEDYAYLPATGRIARSSNLGIIHDQVQYGDQGTAKISTPFGGEIANDLVVGYDVNLIKLTYSNDFGSAPQTDTVDPYTLSPDLFFDTQGIAPRFRTRTVEGSVFAEDRLKLGERISIVGGVRIERDKVRRRNIVYTNGVATGEVSAFPGGVTYRRLRNTTWRVGAVYQPTPTLSLYGQYSTGVDPLGTLTTFSTNATQFYFTNATGDQVEGGVKASFLGGRGSATLAAYRIVKRNLVAQRTPTSPVEQIGQRSSKGIEATLAFDVTRSFGFDANASLLDARFDDFLSGTADFTGRTPPNVPETSANLWLRWSPIERLQARGGLRHVGRMYSDNANAFRVPGYTVIDASLSFAITPHVAVDVHGYNLFDKDYATNAYADRQWILGRPRSVEISLRAGF